MDNKHKKYLDFYENFDSNYDDNKYEYWGLGIENESYLMFDKFDNMSKDFILNNHKRDRYSVDYYKNYKIDKLCETLNKLDNVDMPIYINSYLLQNTDLYGEPINKYTKILTPNPKFCGKTIDTYIKENSNTITNLFKKYVVYDGDTIEFTTFNFYKTSVKDVIAELLAIKNIYLDELNTVLYKQGIFKHEIIYPKLNYGFVRYLTNMNNLGICNNGTYHLNITLPTTLNYNMDIKDINEFNSVHSNAIRAIQWMEPFLVALYGTPDILHLLNKDYAGGSLRLMMSRYIGLLTYDNMSMEFGKKLNDFDYEKKNHYFRELHKNSLYNPPYQIGYDINFNKFKKHGIELRIFDYFPEEYLEDIVNFIILLCQVSMEKNIKNPLEDKLLFDVAIECLKKGSETLIPYELYYKIKKIFNMNTFYPTFTKKEPKTVLYVLNKIANNLYSKYKDMPICKKMSPNMKPVIFTDYNSIVKNEFKKLLH